MPRRSSFLASLLVTLALAIPASVHADEPSATTRAAALLQQGVQKRAEGNDEAALQLFRQADALDSTAKSKAQLGLAEQSLGMWVEAERHLRAALSAVSDAWIEKNRSALEGSLTRIGAELGWIELVGAPLGAAIFIDGQSIGKSPLDAPARASAGTRLLEVKAVGYEPYARRVVVRSGETSRERAVALKLHVSQTPGVSSKNDPRFIDVPGASPLRTVGWITFGTGVAAALFGGTSLIVRQNYVDAYNEDERCPGTAAVDQPASCQSQQGSVSRWTALSAASLIAGGALTAGGLALVFAAPSTHTKVQVARTELRCAVAGVVISCAGRF